jgi:hypothetical protein
MNRASLLLFVSSLLACSSQASPPPASTGDASTSKDAGIDVRPDADAPAVEKMLGLYENYGACTDYRMTHPLAGEENDWAAIQLSPPDRSKPFVVTELVYWLVSGATPGGGTCHPELAHRVKVFTTKGAPAASPASPIVVDVPAVTSPGIRREVSVVLPTPLVVPAGEDVLIAVQMAGAWPNVSCLASCTNTVDVARNFWGTGDTPPHDWKPLSSFGLDVAYLIFAYGNE